MIGRTFHPARDSSACCTQENYFSLLRLSQILESFEILLSVHFSLLFLFFLYYYHWEEVLDREIEENRPGKLSQPAGESTANCKNCLGSCSFPQILQSVGNHLTLVYLHLLSLLFISMLNHNIVSVITCFFVLYQFLWVSLSPPVSTLLSCVSHRVHIWTSFISLVFNIFYLQLHFR